MEPAPRPHALVFPFPAQGHIMPMMCLCRRLASMGFVITFLNTDTNHERIFKGENEMGSDDFRFMSVPDDCLPRDKLGNNVQKFLNAMEQGMRADVEKVLQGLMEDRLRPPVTCMISDAFLGWTQDVAHKFGICRVSFWTPGATACLILLHLPLLQEKGFLPVKGTQIIDFIPGVPPISAKHFPTTIQEEDDYDPGFKHRMHRMSIMKKDAWVFVNSFQELETEPLQQLRKEIPNFVPVGPLIPSPLDDGSGTGLWKEDMICLEWLDRQPPSSVLYISFGSLATFSMEQIKEIFIGLERSEQAFLWVIRLDLLDTEEQRNEILGKIERNKRGMVVSWAPQLKVLQHGSVAAFLTHCGWNSMVEAVASGVPVLGWPCFADQSLDCVLAVEQWKVGLCASSYSHDQNVSATDVEKVVREIMGEQANELRRRARELSNVATRAVSEGGSSYINLQAFLQDMRNRAAATYMKESFRSMTI